MFAFSSSILLMCVRAENMMSDSYLCEKGIKFLILTTPVSLHGDDLAMKETLNKCLKLLEFLEDLRLVLKEINPGKLAKIINKTDIIFKMSNRFRCRTLYIRINKF
jgi:hypothetical protein